MEFYRYPNLSFTAFSDQIQSRWINKNGWIVKNIC